MVDEDGGVLFEADGGLIAPEVAPGDFSVANQIFTLVGVQFPRPGVYKFLVDLGQLPTHETPFVVAQLPTEQSQL